MSEHIVEAIGLSNVTIKDGKVIDVSDLNWITVHYFITTEEWKK